MPRSTATAIAYDHRPDVEEAAAREDAAEARDRQQVRALLPWSTSLNRGFALAVMLIAAGVMFLFLYVV